MQTENVHLLVVEDNPNFLKELLVWLQDFGYQNIATATSAAQAKEKLGASWDVNFVDDRQSKSSCRFHVILGYQFKSSSLGEHR